MDDNKGEMQVKTDEKEENIRLKNEFDQYLSKHIGVNSNKDSEDIIGFIRTFAYFTPKIITMSDELRGHAGSISQRKDRGSPRYDKDNKEIFSKNPGIMLANNPMPQNELLEKTQSNRIVDSFNIAIDKSPKGFSASNTQVPFTNSVSGATYDMIATMSLYMQQHANDPDLNKDINNIVQNFCAFTCKKGYHSMAEMLEVIHSEEAKKVFNEYNVTIQPMPARLLLLTLCMKQQSIVEQII
ncbi:MAG: hypothetical protein KA998_03010 [Rickettsiaceae bacterium]|nr:hypothetical protein [Rickettsiaceae bacterium]